MRIRDIIKKYLPSYKTEKRLMSEIQILKGYLKEMDKKNEYLYMISQKKNSETFHDTQIRICQSMPKATGRLRHIQEAENYILKRVKRLCDENGLELFLVGGTLIGAVRHKGFIPWDNDIDVGMMQGDYLKLRKILEKDDELRAEYCYKYKDGLRMSKIKFRTNNSFWIDILVFEYIDITEDQMDSVWRATQKANKDYGIKIREYAGELVNNNYCRPQENHELDERMAAVERDLLKSLPEFGKGKYFCEPIHCPWWSRDERGIRKVDEYFPLLKGEVEFEGEKYDVWKNYQHALFLSYGDIWKLPFSISEPHTHEFDEELTEGFEDLKQYGLIDSDERYYYEQ